MSRGEVPEWSIGAVSKTVVPRERYRGFESHPLRQISQCPDPCGWIAAVADDDAPQIGVGRARWQGAIGRLGRGEGPGLMPTHGFGERSIGRCLGFDDGSLHPDSAIFRQLNQLLGDHVDTIADRRDVVAPP